MTKNTGRHLTKENREVIEEGVICGESARTIAKRIGVSASTITREVKNHRTPKIRKTPRSAKPATVCSHYRDCMHGGDVCKRCLTRFTTCKNCLSRDCTKTCSEFVRKECPEVMKWPYVCPHECMKRAYCLYPKYVYNATDADASYRKCLSESREGICVTQEELDKMNETIVPLIKKGQSLEAIWATHADEFPVTVRTAYTYQEKEVLGFAAIDMPRKVRIFKKRSVVAPERARVDRTGRTYEDFCQLPLEIRTRVVQGDSVEGFQNNEHDILSLHFVALRFQIYLWKIHGDPKAVVMWFDVIERALKSPEAFEALFGALLLDRGIEFDDWAGMERSCLVPGAKRCRVFYCDPMSSNQKSEAERNHERLRRILPKRRSDFDKLSVWDVSICCSHVNSYPIPSLGGKCPYEVAASFIPSELFDELGIYRVPADEVTLKPSLMAHAVEQ